MSLSAETLQQMQEALGKAFETPMADPRMPESLAKSTFAQSNSAVTGLTFYDLELGAKFLYPVLTPLRNSIPRVSGKGGIQANWKAVTAINTTGVRVGVSGGNRGGVMAVATKDYNAAYKGIGIESSVDFEAQYAGQGFDDIRAIAARSGLQALMLGEELLILGGNTSLALGITPQPSSAGVSTGGALSNATFSIIAVALTLEGIANSSVSGGVPGSITRTNADGSSDTFGGGSAQKSTARSITLAGGTATQSITNAVASVNGAVGYAWYWGAAGSEVLGAITGYPTYTITGNATGTQTAASMPSSDNSQNSLIFDGLLTQAYATNSGATLKHMNGATLTADGSGGIVEFDVVLQSLWDNLRLSPTEIHVSSQQALDVSKKILQGSSTSNLKFHIDIANGMVAGGVMVKEYLNRFSMAGGQTIPIKIHPNMPSGTILFLTRELPYPLNNVGNVIQVRTRQDYYQIEWPLRSRKYEYGVYADEVLQHYFPPSMAVIDGILPG